ncbi:MAG: penicillin-binding transpeptidase domain-containing protein [Oscillospiraceae bacterium]|nr:penicillin-binding transpeptidase domain-containing protein [Oscillospiraceae bacterium]
MSKSPNNRGKKRVGRTIPSMMWDAVRDDKSGDATISPLPGRWMKRKLWVVFAFLFAFVVYIGVNLYNTAVRDSEYYRMRANTQQLDGFVINANRGSIYDRNGKILAQSTTVWDVILSPYDTISVNKEDPAKISRKLSEILELDYDFVLKKFDDRANRYCVLKRKISPEQRKDIMKFKEDEKIGLFSIYLVENTKRDYPNKSLASNVIGFTDYDNKGQYGIEASYDKYLQGRDGRLVMLKDGRGRTMSSEYERRFDAIDGNNLYMTIDANLQHFLEKHLEATAVQHRAGNRATGIMMDPNTGAILAMATTYGYDLNDPTDLSVQDELHIEKFKQSLQEEAVGSSVAGVISAEKQKEIDDAVQNERAKLWEIQWKNKAIGELYFPGSVFKAITCASALEEKVIGLDSHFYCGGGEVIQGVEIGCWHSGHGQLDLVGAVTASCNPAFMDIGARLGTERFFDYFEAFGFTQRSGIDLYGEEYPYTVKRGEMSQVDLAISSFGQTNKITPLQMITAFATCVNGGYLVTPHVVDKITDSDGNVIKSNDSGVKRQVLSKETSETMKYILEEVVTANGGNNAYIPGYRIGGKSGTSEKTDEYSKENLRFVASFCAFAPAENPKVIMLVMVDEPNPGGQPYYGSMVAAPVVSAVFKESFQHLEIYPQYTAEEQAQQEASVPYLIGLTPAEAGMRLNAEELEINEKGEGNYVVRTDPYAGALMKKGGTVVVYYDDSESVKTTVPDVVGMTVSQANRVITDAGLNIRLTGGAIDNSGAIAREMSLPVGLEVGIGTVVEVLFTVDVGHGG